MKELLNVTIAPKTPQMSVYLDSNVCGDQDIAEYVHSMLEYTVLGDIVNLTEIRYDPEVRSSNVATDIAFVEQYYNTHSVNERELLCLSRYVLRMELEMHIFHAKNIQMNDIVQRIQMVYGDYLSTVVSNNNAEILIIRIRLRSSEEEHLVTIEENSPLDVSSLDNDWMLLKKTEKVSIYLFLIIVSFFQNAVFLIPLKYFLNFSLGFNDQSKDMRC